MFGVPSHCPDMPGNYSQARDFFEARRAKTNDYRTIPGFRNTEVRIIERPAAGAPAYAVKLYATDIIIYYPDGRVFLDAYDSATTNMRRNDAGMPEIRTASAMGIPKKDYLEWNARWDLRSQKYPYGLPACDLLLGPHGDVEEIDGKPAADFLEGVRVPKPDAQKLRRSLVRRVRKLLVPYCQALDAMGGDVINFDFDLSDCEELLSWAYDGVDKAQLVVDFVEAHQDWYRFNCLGSTMKNLQRALGRLQPGQNKHDRDLWDWEMVRPEDLAKVIG